MPGKTQVVIHESGKYGHLKFADGTRGHEFSSVVAGTLSFLIGILEGKADPDELKSILSRLQSRNLEEGVPVGPLIAVEFVMEVPAEPRGPTGDPLMN